MNWIFESPVLLGVITAVGSLVLAVVWASNGSKGVAMGLVAWVVLMLGLIGLERYIKTDREKIQLLVQEIVADVKRNDPSLLTKYIHSDATSLYARATGELPKYNFSMLRVTKVHEIVVSEKASPKEGTVDFNILAAGSFSTPGFPAVEFPADQPLPRYIKLFLKQEKDGSWKVEDYDHDNPTAFMFGKQVE